VADANGLLFLRLAEKDGKTIAGEIFGTDGQQQKHQGGPRQEYILKSDRVIYRIRQKTKNTLPPTCGERRSSAFTKTK